MVARTHSAQTASVAGALKDGSGAPAVSAMANAMRISASSPLDPNPVVNPVEDGILVDTFVDVAGELTVTARLPRGVVSTPSATEAESFARACVARILRELERFGVGPRQVERSRIGAADSEWLPALIASRDAALKPGRAISWLMLHTSECRADAFVIEFDARIDARTAGRI